MDRQASRLALIAAIAMGWSCGADKGDGGGSGAGSGNTGKGGNGSSNPFQLPDPNDPRSGAGNGSGAGTGTGGDENGCEPNLTGIVRDFTPSHPDFQAYTGNGPSLGIVKDRLGSDRKPVYSGTGAFVDPVNEQQVTSKASFDKWYRDVDGDNQRFEHRLMLTPQANGVFSFDSDAFFPIDGKGFGDYANGHNYHFTFELHTEFAYNGGEVFTFKGDDDLWVFINGRLALDLGGLHPREEDTVSLDDIAAEFGLSKGKTYPLELFHAERRTDHSNFRIDTTIKFTNCNPIIID